jgi:hypothetical protein
MSQLSCRIDFRDTGSGASRTEVADADNDEVPPRSHSCVNDDILVITQNQPYGEHLGWPLFYFVFHHFEQKLLLKQSYTDEDDTDCTAHSNEPGDEPATLALDDGADQCDDEFVFAEDVQEEMLAEVGWRVG